MADIREFPTTFAVIPASVRYDDRITPNAKLLYGEITALSNKYGVCWANNEYFAKLYGTTDKTIRRWIGSLEEAGYIEREIVYKEGTKEVKKRYLKLSDSQMSVPMDKNVPTPTDKIFHGGTDKNVRENNTSISNNTSINNINNIYRERNIKERENAESVIEYLNEVCGTRYRCVEKYVKHITARFREGFDLEDFKTVVDKKHKAWANDPKMSKYLRPETLFGTKFESYLNELVVNETQKPIWTYSKTASDNAFDFLKKG